MKIVENTPDELILRSRPILMLSAFWLVGLATLYIAVRMPDAPDYFREATFGFAVLIIVFAWRALPFLTVTFDRPGEVIIREVRRITGTRREIAPLPDVRSAKVRSAILQGVFLRCIVLITEAGPVPLENGFAGMPRERIARSINKWLARAIT